MRGCRFQRWRKGTGATSISRAIWLVWVALSFVQRPEDITEVPDHDIVDVTANASRIALDEGFAHKGDVIAIAAGIPFGVAGNTNLLKLPIV